MERKEAEKKVREKYKRIAQRLGISPKEADEIADREIPYNSTKQLENLLKMDSRAMSAGSLDPAHRDADLEIGKMSREVESTYKRAADEMQEKLDKYLANFNKAVEKKQKDLADGKITEQEYKDWYKKKLANKVLRTKTWEGLKKNLAEDASNSNDIARSIMYGHLPDVYANNYNFGTYEIEKGAGVDTSFTLYNKDTVERLMREDQQLLPPPPNTERWRNTGIDVAKGVTAKKKDIAWNSRAIQNELIQGILQGESIPNLSKRLQHVQLMNQRASIRYARTMVTGAQNAGRNDAYQRAQDKGMNIFPTWTATLDNRTRDSHRALDGEKRDPETKTFSNGCRFPGDPQGRPEEVYNCRCRMIAQIKGHELDFSDPSWRPSEAMKDMTYDEWKKGHQKKQQTIEDRTDAIDEIMSAKNLKKMTDSQKTEFRNILQNMTNTNFKTYQFMAKHQGNNSYFRKNTGYYRPSERKVMMDLRSTNWEHEVGRKNTGAWKTKFHEELHQFDHMIATGEGMSTGAATKTTDDFIARKGVFGDRLSKAITKDMKTYINNAIEKYEKEIPRRAKEQYLYFGYYNSQEEAEAALRKGVAKVDDISMIHAKQSDIIIKQLKADLREPKDKALASAFTDCLGLSTEGGVDGYMNGFWGHKRSYSEDRGMDGAASECFAEIGSHIMRNDTEALDELRKFMPETVAEYEKIFSEDIPKIIEKEGKNIDGRY